ncbi:hypothetical protein V6N13_050392 [Hibiscus sabdariffa]
MTLTLSLYRRLNARLGIQDSVRWNSDSNGSFSVKSLLNLIGPPLGTKDVVWKYCWSKLASPNVELFVWKAAHGRLATKVELLKRNLNIHDSVLCPSVPLSKNLSRIYYAIVKSLRAFGKDGVMFGTSPSLSRLLFHLLVTGGVFIQLVNSPAKIAEL